jgi:predicted transcriptional regulator
MRDQTSANKMATSERRKKAIELRKAGYTYQEIGEKLGITKQAAHKHIKKLLQDDKEQSQDQAREYRAIGLLRLEELFKKFYLKGIGGSIADAEQARKIQADITKLSGAEMPIKTAITTKDGENDIIPDGLQMTESEIDQRIAELQQKFEND